MQGVLLHHHGLPGGLHHRADGDGDNHEKDEVEGKVGLVGPFAGADLDLVRLLSEYIHVTLGMTRTRKRTRYS